MFQPNLGRWMQMDPIGFASRERDLYVVESNDPENHLDPTGLKKYTLKFQSIKGFAPKLGNCGSFSWRIDFLLAEKMLKGQGGYIVQHITRSYEIKDKNGKKLTFPEIDTEKEYWEAFEVHGNDEQPTFADLAVPGPTDNFWLVASDGGEPSPDGQNLEGTEGWYEIKGEAVYYDGLTLPDKFKLPGAIKSAPGLAGTLDDPKINHPAADTSNTLTRSIRVKWNCCPGSESKKTQLVHRTPKDG